MQEGVQLSLWLLPPAEIGPAQQEIPVDLIVFIVAAATMATLAVRGSKVK